MKKILLAIIFFLIATPAKSFEEGILKTSDDINIAYNHYKTGHNEALIIAPGWFMTKDSAAFKKMSNDFSKYFDVITFDFRGHQKSSGFYTFGSLETKDLTSVVRYANTKYEKVYLIGFSLGALISVDYCAKNLDVEKLILVSAPVEFGRIENNIFDKHAFIPTFIKFELDRWTSIRFTGLNHKKPKPIDLIDKITIPILFIAGENDPIIKTWHNDTLFQKANTQKQEITITNANHAEDIYLDYPLYFIAVCTKFLKSEFALQKS